MATEKQTAGAFDIRNIIGALMGVFGVILLLMGLFGDKAYDKTGDVNANLYAGLGLLATCAFFVVWAKVKPIVVPAHVEPAEVDPTRPAPRPRGHGH